MEDIKVGDIIEVVVTGIQKYGAFVLVDGKYDGLIHISEISSGYVRNINDYIKIKDKIYAQVVDVDKESNKFKLSIKNIDYRNDGGPLSEEDNFSNGFEPLKEHLDLWINEKIKEISFSWFASEYCLIVFKNNWLGVSYSASNTQRTYVMSPSFLIYLPLLLGEG